MAILSLLGAFGLDASGSFKPGSHLAAAFSQLPHLQNVPLDQVEFTSEKANLTFQEPIALSVPGVALTIGAGLNGNIRIRSAKEHTLDTGDPFASIQIKDDEAYLCVELTFSATSSATVGPTICAFGLSVSKGLKVAVHRRFYRSDSGSFPLFGEALSRVLDSFLIPQSQADLDALDRDVVVLVNGTGQLKLISSFGISAPVTQLAATSPIAGQVVQINTSATFKAAFSLTLEGGYFSRIRKLESQALEICIGQPESSTFAVQVSASAGLVASVGTFDLAEKFLGAISRNPLADLEEFRRALPGEDQATRDLQITGFQNDLAAAVCTKIGVSLSAGLSTATGTNQVMIFEVAADSIDTPTTVSALVSAMNGDFKLLTNTPLPPGTRQTANIFSESKLAKQQIAVNLLGIVNFVSIGKLARVSKIERNATGEITCTTDSADANRLQALLLNVAGNTKRLRALLSEDFLFQATFKSANLRVLPPDYSAKHTFLEINNKTDSEHMREMLNVCSTLAVLTPADETSRLQGRNDFGRTTFWLQTTYSQSAIERTFLTSNGEARTEPDFVLQARQALGQLIAGGEGQEFRKLVADLGPKGNSIWEAMRKSGNREKFNGIFGLPQDAKDPLVEAAGSDYSCITSWASAMKGLADIIVETRTLMASSVAPDDSRLIQLHQHLRDRMADVVKNSGEHFGEPLGLMTVYLASGRSAGARVIASGPSIEPLNKSNPPNTLANSVKA